mmetsp:Transcript_22100/g.86900  ORF Transcript_22100/g.86900 Transcript_22100/m.86900 type:complete len:635 (+) Transcript_22100:47-1951(+)
MGGKHSQLKLKAGDVVSSAKAKEVWEAYYSPDVGTVDEAGARRFLSDYRRKLRLDKAYEEMFDEIIEQCSVKGAAGRVFDLDAFRALLRTVAAAEDSPVTLTESMALPSSAEPDVPTLEQIAREQRMCATVAPVDEPLEMIVAAPAPPPEASPGRCPSSSSTDENELKKALFVEMCAMVDPNRDEDYGRPLGISSATSGNATDVMCEEEYPDKGERDTKAREEAEVREREAIWKMMCDVVEARPKEKEKKKSIFSRLASATVVKKAGEKLAAVPRIFTPADDTMCGDEIAYPTGPIMCADVPMDVMCAELPHDRYRDLHASSAPVYDSSDEFEMCDDVEDEEPRVDIELLRSSTQGEDAAKRITFSVDLLTHCETLLNGIAEFAAREDLHTDAALEYALVRYELFLALYCQVAAREGDDAAQRLIPPVDVAHVWRAHLIRPLTYRKDCQELFGRQIKATVLFSVAFKTAETESEKELQRSARDSMEKETRERWERMIQEEELPEIPFEATAETLGGLPNAEVSLGLPHLREDILWWTNFRKGWGEEYDSDRKEFLKQREEGYKDFLIVAASRQLERAENPEADVESKGPFVDVDLFWHCHMMFPCNYDHDISSQLGCRFYHRPAADPESQASKK